MAARARHRRHSHAHGTPSSSSLSPSLPTAVSAAAVAVAVAVAPASLTPSSLDASSPSPTAAAAAGGGGGGGEALFGFGADAGAGTAAGAGAAGLGAAGTAADTTRQAVIQAALEGRSPPQDFRSIVVPFVDDQNALHAQHCGVVPSRAMLEFQGPHGAPCPVVPQPADDEPLVPNVSGGDAALLAALMAMEGTCVETLTLENRSRTPVTFRIQMTTNNKFSLVVSPQQGEIKRAGRSQADPSTGSLGRGSRRGKAEKEKAKSSVTLHFALRVFCTTRVYQILRISITRRGEEIGRLWVGFKVQSELSNQLDADEVEVGERIGSGAFGSVYKATWRGSQCAVKMLHVQEMVDSERALVKREIRLMSKLAHPNIVTFMGATTVRDQPLYIVMEFIRGGSLTGLLKRQSLPPAFKCKLLLDICDGIIYLHSNSICHRDIKPDNMLVASSSQNTATNIKITDFGTSRAQVRRSTLYGSTRAVQHAGAAGAGSRGGEADEERGVGTFLYQSPEILEGVADFVVEKTDVYAMGILMWECFTGREPYSNPETAKMGKWDLEKHVIGGNRPVIDPSFPPQLTKLLQACWHQSPEARPTFSQIRTSLEELRSHYRKQAQAAAAAAAPRPAADRSAARSAAPGPTVPIPDCDPQEIGWARDMTREVCEAALRSAEPNAFLVRWSGRTASYVLSYHRGGGGVHHIGFIKPTPSGGVVVTKENGAQDPYESLLNYVKSMQENGIIRLPLNTSTAGTSDSTYDVTPVIRD